MKRFHSNPFAIISQTFRLTVSRAKCNFAKKKADTLKTCSKLQNQFGCFHFRSRIEMKQELVESGRRTTYECVCVSARN